jgi:septal ring factor EnvC (AmiA/AmiB activator)
MLNIDNALDESNEWWQRAALVLGWNTWDLGIRDKDIEELKKEVKKEKRDAKNYENKRKKKEKEIEKLEKEKVVIEKNKKKKDGRCAAISSSGKRCSNKAIKDGLCTIHEKTEKRKSGKKFRCIERKADGTRCKMMTSNKSQLCYYHD